MNDENLNDEFFGPEAEEHPTTRMAGRIDMAEGAAESLQLLTGSMSRSYAELTPADATLHSDALGPRGDDETAAALQQLSSMLSEASSTAERLLRQLEAAKVIAYNLWPAGATPDADRR